MKTNDKLEGTRKCLSSLSSARDVTLELMHFAKASRGTARRWRLHGILPNGEKLLRLQYFLILLGYELPEFNGLPWQLIDLGKCIALNVITVGEVAETLGLSHYKRVYDYFRKDIHLTPQKMRAVESILSGKAEALKTSLQQTDESLKHISALSTHSKKCVQEGTLIEDFRLACEKVRELGGKLLEGPASMRIRMRTIMCTGREPELQLTWEVLNNLLREKTPQSQ